MKESTHHPHGRDGLVRVGPLMSIPEIVRGFGHDPEAVFSGTGLALNQFQDPDFKVSYRGGGKLLANCVAVTGCDHFGLIVGRQAGPSALGVAGFMLQSAPDVGTALRDLLQHLVLHDEGGVVVLQALGRVAFLGYAIHQPGVEARDQISDLSIAIACKVMRSLCGESWKPTEVLLSRGTPKDPSPFSRFYRAPLRFNADQAALVFSASWLSQKVRGADRLLRRHLEKEASKLHGEREKNFLADFRALLRRSILLGKFTAPAIADQLFLHERTLNRRLRSHGTNFRREAAKVRLDLACQLLVETDMPINKISAALNYSDLSAFNRAFKRWTGDTPASWRSRVKASE